MGVVFVSGDLFCRPRRFGAIAHGCNCAGAMGKGIAVAFRAAYPDMYTAYRAACASGALQPGGVFAWPASDGWVYNLGTQRSWRSRARLPDVRSALVQMLEHACAHGVPEVAMPLVGAGLGGLSPAEVQAVLVELSLRYPTDLVIFQRFKPGQVAAVVSSVGRMSGSVARSLLCEDGGAAA